MSIVISEAVSCRLSHYFGHMIIRQIIANCGPLSVSQNSCNILLTQSSRCGPIYGPFYLAPPYERLDPYQRRSSDRLISWKEGKPTTLRRSYMSSHPRPNSSKQLYNAFECAATVKIK